MLHIPIRRALLGIFFMLISVFSFEIHAQVNCNNVSQTGIPKVQCEALVNFYISTQGPSWKEECKTNWLSDAPVDSWEGVQVVQGNVDGLVLNSCNLKGVLPNSIVNLKQIRFLSLAYNQLSGQLPLNIGNLNRLVAFIVFSNKLTGPIPPSVSNLDRLKDFNLVRNYFRGTISNSLFNPNLSDFRLLLAENCFSPLSPDEYIQIALNPIFHTFHFFIQRPSSECRIKSAPSQVE